LGAFGRQLCSAAQQFVPIDLLRGRRQMLPAYREKPSSISRTNAIIFSTTNAFPSHPQQLALDIEPHNSYTQAIDPHFISKKVEYTSLLPSKRPTIRTLKEGEHTHVTMHPQNSLYPRNKHYQKQKLNIMIQCITRHMQKYYSKKLITVGG